MKKIPLSFIFALLLFAPALAAGQQEIDPAASLKKAAELYEQGSYSQALEQANTAVSQIRQKMSEHYKDLFPPAPAGWQADEAKVATAEGLMSFTGSTAERAYRHLDGKSIVTMQILHQSPLGSMAAAAMANPSLAQTAGYKRIPMGEYTGLSKADQSSASLSLLKGATLVNVEARGSEDNEKTALSFMELVDWDKIRKQLEP